MFGLALVAVWRYVALALLVALASVSVYAAFERTRANLMESQRDVARNERKVLVSQYEFLAARGARQKLEAEGRWADNLRAAASLAATYHERWMRAKRDIGLRGLPDAPDPAAGRDRKGQICLDRAAVDGALQSYRRRISGLLDEGDQAIADRLECVAGWPTNKEK